jgi:hypothetical protein
MNLAAHAAGAVSIDHAHAQRDRVARVVLGHRGNEGGLVGGAASGDLAMNFAAPGHVVDLDHPGRLPLGIAFEHDLQELVLDAPFHGVGHPEMALERKGGNGVFLPGQEVHGKKPRGQGQRAIGEDRAGCQRGLVATMPALHQVARAQDDEALGMPQCGQTKPRGQRQPNSASADCSSVPYCAGNSGNSTPS